MGATKVNFVNEFWLILTNLFKNFSYGPNGMVQVSHHSGHDKV